MVVSFHPCFEADVNLLVAGRDPAPEELDAIRAADAVVLPQGCRLSLYEPARRFCSRVFPNYDARFAYPGKTGQIRLFRRTGTPHPRSVLFEDVEQCLASFAKGRPMAFPLVFKFDWGGEGEGVFFFDAPEALCAYLEQRKKPPTPCLVQTFVPGACRTLRVVVIGRRVTSYWRRGEGFYAGVARGGSIDAASDPQRQALGRKAVRTFCKKTAVDLAGFDLIFPPGRREPLLLEINYFFGRRGLGGSTRFYRMLTEQIRQWLQEAR